MHASKKIILTYFILVLLLNGYRCVSVKFIPYQLKNSPKNHRFRKFPYNQKIYVASLELRDQKVAHRQCMRKNGRIYVRESLSNHCDTSRNKKKNRL
jgi:hypothetical protein